MSSFKHQSRVIRRSTLSGLTSILEEEPAPELTKNNSMKAKRRHGVSDLAIPRTSPLFTAVQRTPCLDSDYECPRPSPPLPRCDSPSSESEGSRSGSASPSVKRAAHDAHALAHRGELRRRGGAQGAGGHSLQNHQAARDRQARPCRPSRPRPRPPRRATTSRRSSRGRRSFGAKPSKPLAIVKRAVSPIPPPPQPVASTSTLPPADECEEEDDDAWQDDDEYYAAHAGSFITLAPPLPPVLPCLPLLRVVVHVCRAAPRVCCYPDSLERCAPPPKTPLPTDALSTPWSGDWTAYAPFGTPSPSSQHSHSSDSNSACSSSSERLAALLSPSPASSSGPQRRFPAETQGVPSDVSSSSEWEEEDEAWEACAVSYGDAYEDVPLSPLVAPPVPPRLLPTQPRNEASSSANKNPNNARCAPRWSSSTLSSVHSAHAHGRRSPGVASSPKTFAFARAAGGAASPSASKLKPKPMGSATVLNTPSPKRGKGRGGKRLTVEDVLVISPASPAPVPATPTPTPTCGATAPRQRWSYSSRASSSRAAPSGSESSDSGHSDSDDCGSECSGGSEGMRRKPIPVGLFLR
ncbi:hypothetical protein B0H14DRAFT_3177580 [Mycena olivaceomarginata]|nr:hypothetical protein B0H14DRAFT_3177580 [Mycena olivaceomarginata]